MEHYWYGEKPTIEYYKATDGNVVDVLAIPDLPARPLVPTRLERFPDMPKSL